MNHNLISAYLQSIQRAYDSRSEYAYRMALKTLLESAEAGLRAVGDSYTGDVPDLILIRAGTPVGYVKTAGLGGDLNALENNLQVVRYRASMPNLLLTNYLEFRWYTGGQLRRTARVAELSGSALQRERSADGVMNLLGEFARFEMPRINTAHELAVRLGLMARELRYAILAALTGDTPGRDLTEQMQAFRDTLLPDLTPEQFADQFAQAIAYGLFAARIRHRGAARKSPFTRRDAFWDLPATNPLLKTLFQQIEGSNLDERVSWAADAIADLLAHTDTEAVLSGFRQGRRQEDPINNFYETFIQHYDPDSPVIRATAESAATFLVRSVDYLLRKRFKRAFGLADENIYVLDPAAGTGTFLYYVVQQVYDRLWQQHQLGVWDIYVRDNLLPRVFGFERWLASYAVAHLKLALQLAGTGYTFANNQRLGVYLARTLADTPEPKGMTNPLAQAIVRESREAAITQRDAPIKVILGSPPGDDARFWQFGQQRIAQTGSGILAYVTTSRYLDDPAFMEVRRGLTEVFDDLYIVHTEDFTISLFVKRPEGDRLLRVRYAEVPENVLDWLAHHDLTSVQWQEIKPSAPFYRFTPQSPDLNAEYEEGWKLDDIFSISGQDGDPSLLVTAAYCWLANSPLLPDTLHEPAQVFPLYLRDGGHRANLNQSFILEVAKRTGLTLILDGRGDLRATFGPDDVFDYAYAVLSSPAYQERYTDFFSTPRLPLTSSRKLFRSLAKRGRRLAALHALQQAESWRLVTGYTGPGTTHTVAEGYPRFLELAGERGGRVYINRDKYVQNVERDVWNFRLGDVQLLRAWLEARQGQTLEWPEIHRCQQIIVALLKTLRIEREIDDLIPAWPLR